MNHIFDAIILGTVQGLTEFLPVSSSGHLLLAHYFLGYDAGDSFTFDVALHVGTLFALLIFFWRDITSLLRNWLASFGKKNLTPEQRLPWMIIIAALPAAIFGGLFDSFFAQLRSPWIIVVTFTIFGILFLLAERLSQRMKNMNDVRWPAALSIGLAQVAALVPGVSRSGVTIVAGMYTGLTREQAARFTFLLSIPVVAGAAAKKLLDARDQVIPRDERTAMIIGIITAAVVGYTVIRFLLRFLGSHRLNVFAYYRFAVAIIVAIGLFFQA